MSYIANTPSDQEAMLKQIGISSGKIDDLFKSIPASLRIDALKLAPGKSELEVRKILHQMAGRNTSHLQCFVGGGFYDHFDADGKLISSIDAVTVRQLSEAGIITGGMIPKINYALEALQQGVEKVPIINGKKRHALLMELFTDKGIGTEMTMA